jgi:hypothetical protein
VYTPKDDNFEDKLAEDNSWLFEKTLSIILLNDKLKGTDLWSYLPYQDWAKRHFILELS